jgi:hypothetical protein
MYGLHLYHLHYVYDEYITPSEQVFSTTGLIINAKRIMLSPENIGKIQVIHGNYNLSKKVQFLFYCCLYLWV